MLKELMNNLIILCIAFMAYGTANAKTADVMPVTVRVNEDNPKAFEKDVKRAKALGYEHVYLRANVTRTNEQVVDEQDKWEHMVTGLPALFKVFETDLVNGYFKPENLRKNQEALKWKSDILIKHKMKASIEIREPQWMKPSWYKGREELMGARCDHPGVSRSPHHALNIDHEDVLKHYYQLAKKLVMHAPAVERIFLHSNDAGAGINWCEGLYPGRNGPANTEHRDMGQRIQGWFQAMRDGSRAGGQEVRIDFWPRHFTHPEIRSVAKALRPPSRLVCVAHLVKNVPFIDFQREVGVFRKAIEGTRTEIIVHDRGFSNSAGPASLPFVTGELYLDLWSQDIRFLETRPLPKKEMSANEILARRCMETLPKNAYELDQLVLSVANKMVGKRHGKALYSAWKDFNSGIKLIRFDYNVVLDFAYSVWGRRWLVRPFVPVPESLSPDEREYWFLEMAKDPNPKITKERMVVLENHSVFTVDQYPIMYNGHEMSQPYFDRAVKVMDDEIAKIRKGMAVWNRMKNERDRLDMARRLYKCQLHAIGMEWIIDRFSGKPEVDRWAQSREKKRMFNMIDKEIVNCQEVIQLLKDKNPECRLVRSPDTVIEQLGKKIDIMKKHRHRVDEVFPGIAATAYQVFNFSEKDGKFASPNSNKKEDSE